jgi:hypothetical protein
MWGITHKLYSILSITPYFTYYVGQSIPYTKLIYKLVQHFWYSRKTGFHKIKMLPKLRDDSRLDQCNWTITNIQSVLLQP